MVFWTVPIDQSAAFPGSNSSVIKRVDRPALLKRTRPDQVRSDHAANLCCAKCYFGSPGDSAEHTGSRRNRKCCVVARSPFVGCCRSTEKLLARRASIDRRPAGEFDISGATAVAGGTPVGFRCACGSFSVPITYPGVEYGGSPNAAFPETNSLCHGPC